MCLQPRVGRENSLWAPSSSIHVYDLVRGVTASRSGANWSPTEWNFNKLIQSSFAQPHSIIG